MKQEFAIRIASSDDMLSLAKLCWRLKEGDSATTEGDVFTQYVDEFTRFERMERASNEIVHWIADVSGRPAAAMSVVQIRKVISPARGISKWGYLTNCYVASEYRNAGLGQNMMAAIQAWARDQAFEFIIVWPSDRAIPFYERSGFRPPNDLLVWTPDEQE